MAKRVFDYSEIKHMYMSSDRSLRSFSREGGAGGHAPSHSALSKVASKENWAMQRKQHQTIGETGEIPMSRAELQETEDLGDFRDRYGEYMTPTEAKTFFDSFTDPSYTSLRPEIALYDVFIGEEVKNGFKDDPQVLWEDMRGAVAGLALAIDKEEPDLKKVVQNARAVCFAYDRGMTQERHRQKARGLMKEKRDMVRAEMERIKNATDFIHEGALVRILEQITRAIVKHVPNPQVQRALCNEVLSQYDYRTYN